MKSHRQIPCRLRRRMLCVVFRLSLVAAAPAVFAGYLVLLGFASLLMRAIGWSLPYVVQWFLIIAGLLIVFVFAFSGKVRSSVPDRLFEPFTTCKPTGSGIGFWQAIRLLESFGGTTGADTLAAGGAKFVIQLPKAKPPSE